MKVRSYCSFQLYEHMHQHQTPAMRPLFLSPKKLGLSHGCRYCSPSIGGLCTLAAGSWENLSNGTSLLWGFQMIIDGDGWSIWGIHPKGLAHFACVPWLESASLIQQSSTEGHLCISRECLLGVPSVNSLNGKYTGVVT